MLNTQKMRQCGYVYFMRNAIFHVKIDCCIVIAHIYCVLLFSLELPVFFTIEMQHTSESIVTSKHTTNKMERLQPRGALG